MPTAPTPSGRLSESGAVVFSRRLPRSRAEAWAAVTDPTRTARWIGPWSGDPASGTVQLTMTAEEGDPVDGVEVVTCDAPGFLVVRTGPGGWLLTVRIEGDDDEGSGKGSNEAVISLEQDIADAESAASIGPGWDYYLDRLVEAEAGRDPDALRFEPDYYPGLAEYYRNLVGG
ncbi:transcriptional regulator [Dietzia natronolimnaea]|uniref:Transcriptional regulator n=1 Tax=Dietzia natronolimnaea TaxID=161920 RepID=A0A2A2WQ81_9ACTN|nr:transcriptional regulator [Dietzia natronolimnaea]PAY23389.1 transcriptional regulator [Dietzia natronolimnaea]